MKHDLRILVKHRLVVLQARAARHPFHVIRVMLELERDRLVAELKAEFDRDRDSGRLAKLSEIIRATRAALALRSAGSA